MRNSLRLIILVLTATVWTMLASVSAYGATNVATGTIGDNSSLLDGGDGTGSARFTLQSTRLALHKQARLADGTILADGADVQVGETIWFVLWVENPTLFDATALTMVDQLNQNEFQYISGSIETALLGAGATDDELWAAGWQARTDAVAAGDDVASITDTGGPPQADRLTVGDVAGQVNGPLTVPPQRIFALRFQVTVL